MRSTNRKALKMKILPITNNQSISNQKKQDVSFGSFRSIGPNWKKVVALVDGAEPWNDFTNLHLTSQDRTLYFRLLDIAPKDEGWQEALFVAFNALAKKLGLNDLEGKPQAQIQRLASCDPEELKRELFEKPIAQIEQIQALAEEQKNKLKKFQQEAQEALNIS